MIKKIIPDLEMEEFIAEGTKGYVTVEPFVQQPQIFSIGIKEELDKSMVEAKAKELGLLEPGLEVYYTASEPKTCMGHDYYAVNFYYG